MRELLSNNSLFVGHLYKDKSLALRARDLFFFTTDLDLIYFINERRRKEGAIVIYLTIYLRNLTHTVSHFLVVNEYGALVSFHCVILNKGRLICTEIF